MMKQLIVTGLTKTFGQGDNIVHALLDVNLSVEKGEFLAVMGASGSGKTTLLNCISTIDKPTSGEIRFEDFDIIHAKENELADYRAKNISYIFQAYNLVETLTVYENIILPLQIQGKNIKKHQDKIEEILDKLAIQNLKDKFPNQLSGGQRQRVATARALIDDSKLIIADEPTGALDSANSEKLKNNLGLKFAFRSTDLNEIKKTLAFFGVDPEDENNQKRLRDLENGQCLISDLYGRVGVIQFHPVFEELLHAFDTRPPVRKEV